MFSYNADKGEILLYDVIGEAWDGSGASAANIMQALEQMDGKRVTVRINSPGGIADEGVAMYNVLKQYEGGVDTVVDALAASAASIVALAGEKRTTLRGARWMIHRAMGVGIGNAKDMRKLADILEVYDRSLADIYADHMQGVEKDEILRKMTAETWFDAEASLSAGLSTHTKIDEPFEQATALMADWFEHPPEDLAKQPSAPKLKKVAANREIARLKNRLAGLI